MAEQTQTEVQEQEYAPGWKPTKGETVGGKVIGIDARESSFGNGPYPIVTLEDEGGSQVAIHAFHTVLRRELARRRPKIGDELEITYLGKKGEGGSYGNGYDMYKVRGGQEQGGYDWSRDLPEDERDQVPIQQAPIPPPSPGPPPVAEDTSDLPF